MKERMIPRPPSPCKEICKLDASASVCTGCGRTLGEIAEWGSATASRQHEIIRRASAKVRAFIDLAVDRLRANRLIK